MPGPKMGPRPADFDENLVRQAPTFQRWLKLYPGQKLRYACRDFVKGHGDDEERLMRRIMIARRNNLRDHAILKKARAHTGKNPSPKSDHEDDDEEVGLEEPPKKKRSALSYLLTDEEVMKEMDIPAVEGTRSFKTWLMLEDGQAFTYNQTYIKGKDDHEWLLKKNIWRRMRYRRENKKMVEQLKGGNEVSNLPAHVTSMHEGEQGDEGECCEEVDPGVYSTVSAASVATHIVDHTLSPNLLSGTEVPAPSLPVNLLGEDVAVLGDGGDDGDMHLDVVEAAVAAAESYVKQARESDTVELAVAAQTSLEQPVPVPVPVPVEANPLTVHNPIMTMTSNAEGESMNTTSLAEHHTPNPLVGFDGDALDVAAKLAAAASANAKNESDDDYAAV